MDNRHPYVSERREGRPWFEWCVAGCVAVSAVLGFLGYTMAATALLSVTAIASGIIRVACRDASPWKIRSVAFDAWCGIGSGLALLVLYGSILLLNH